ncbi:MAG: acyl-CoA dehydrogenase family protein [Bacteriovorax sp.]|nr:acyl-CoA dehydrogenase family protein [Bacteriovorax sp.]
MSYYIKNNSRTLSDLEPLIEKIKIIGKDIIAVHADNVDQEARFPLEAINALKNEKLLSCYVPVELGGMGLSVLEVSKICEVIGAFCSSTAMIFAMHQIQAAIIVHHGLSSKFFESYAKELVEKQFLLASATTELGIGGDVRSSICAPSFSENFLRLEKQASVISYGAYADAILVTCRKSSEASRNDQIEILVKKEDYTLKELSGWDTLGFRGTCSNGFVLNAKCNIEQILPVDYAEIHRITMHPFAHSVWAALWLGIASESVRLARSAVRIEARKNPDLLPPSALRLAEVDSVLFSMRGGSYQAINEYQQYLTDKNAEAFTNFGFTSRINNLKITSSQLIIEIVGKSMLICGISGYRNDSKLSLGRLLRDAYGASLMVNNDRILGQSAMTQIMQRD